jgi:hypothetical protein
MRERLLTAASLLLVWVALLVPAHPADLDPVALLRLPVEALVLAAAALVLPVRAGRVVAVVGGLLLWSVVVIALLDLVFRTIFDRPFNPVVDHAYGSRAVVLAEDLVGRWPGRAVVAVVVVAALALMVVLPRALLRLTRVAREHRAVTWRGVVVLTVAWAVAAVAGLGLAAANAAGLASDTVAQVRTEIAEQRAFEAALVDDPARGTSPTFALLQGKDVVVVFVESYGRTALDSARVQHALAEGDHALTEAGWTSRSAWLTSPTYGALSWFAHSTLHSGMWVDNESRYDALLGSGRQTLSRMMGAAGWRTVAVVPSNREPWPEGERFYGWDKVYAAADLGYRGPKFGYATMPDQYTLAALARLELGGPAPVAAEVDLATSHSPWAPLPRMVPWPAVGDGSVFGPMPDQATSSAEVWSDGDRVRDAYDRSIAYSLEAVGSFLARQHGDDLVVLLLGDHQPARVVTERGTSAPGDHDVPVTLLARDPAVIDAAAPWGWQPGLWPSADAPVWPMDEVRDRFVAAYSPGR